MALVGSLSGSLGLIAVTGSFEPGTSNTFSIGTSSKKWSNIVSTALSGSLTKLADGTSSFIVAGSNITVTTGSNGQITIAGSGGGSGDVVGPAAATDNAIARFDTATGKLLQDTSGVTIDDSFNVVSSGSFSTKSAGGSQVANISNAGVISGSGNLQVGGNITVAGNIDGDAAGAKTLFASAGASTITVGATTSTVIVNGDLYVKGTTTTISSSNLVVQDPMIYFGSGSVTSNQNGGIALASGSSVANQSLVWGRVANDIWGAGRQDVAAGVTSDLTTMTLVPIRSSKIEIGGTNAYVTSSNGNILELNGSAGSGTIFSVGGGTQLAKLFDNGALTELRALSDKQLTLSGSNVNITGSAINLNASNNGIVLQRNGTNFGVFDGNSSTLSITPGSGFLTASIVNSISEVINFGGAGTTINIGNPSGVVTFANAVNVNGNATFGNATSDRVLFNAYVTSSILPSDDLSFTLGSEALRWQHIYTGDLHLRNDRGDYTLIEEEDFLSIRFNKTGKRYKFLLEAVPELDESKN